MSFHVYVKGQNQQFDPAVTEELLFKYFVGNASSVEQAYIHKWLEASEANREFYLQTELLHKDVKALASIGEEAETRYDSEIAWAKLSIPKSKTRSLFDYTGWAACAALLIVGVLVWMTYGDAASSTEELISYQQIESKVFQDGSEVTLNIDSKLEYPAEFSESERRVELTGEAYFEIAKNPDKPFIIDVGGAQVEVLGTSFNVYSSESSIEVLVDEGLVRMSNGIEEIYLGRGAHGVLDLSTNTLTKNKEDQVWTDQYWKTKTLRFEDNTLSQVVEALNEVYDVDVHLQTPQIKDCTITVQFEDEDIDRVMDILSATLNLSINKKSNHYYINGKETCKI